MLKQCHIFNILFCYNEEYQKKIWQVSLSPFVYCRWSTSFNPQSYTMDLPKIVGGAFTYDIGWYIFVQFLDVRIILLIVNISVFYKREINSFPQGKSNVNTGKRKRKTETSYSILDELLLSFWVSDYGDENCSNVAHVDHGFSSLFSWIIFEIFIKASTSLRFSLNNFSSVYNNAYEILRSTKSFHELFNRFLRM